MRRAAALTAAPAATLGRFQLEAAIQAVHCARLHTGRTDWAALDTLYRALLQVAPILGARVAHARVVLHLDGPQNALSLLDTLATEASSFQPWHAVRAEALTQAGDHEGARSAYRDAIALTDHHPTRTYLYSQLSRRCVGR